MALRIMTGLLQYGETTGQVRYNLSMVFQVGKSMRNKKEWDGRF